MKEYQCADILINYFETENEAYMRQMIFDCLFIENYNASMDDGLLCKTMSMAVSVQAKSTLECCLKFIKLNLNKPCVHKLFKHILVDQFGLAYANATKSVQLDTLQNTSLVFTAVLINISLNLLHEEQINDLILRNFLKTLIVWLKSDNLLMLLLNEKNFNIFQNLFNLAYIHPLSILMSQNEQADSQMQKLFADMNIIFLKMIQRFTDDILQNIPNQSIIDLSYLNTIKKKFALNPNKIMFKRCYQALQLLIHKSLVDFNKDYLKQLFESLDVNNGLDLDFII
jgi:hypothetical protein